MALRYALSGIMLLSALSLAQVARASHDGGGDCYDCHDLTNTNVEPGTHLLSRSAMAELRSNGWSSGMRPGCTFCHRSVNSTHIADALTDFVGAWASRHPTGRNFVTKAADNSAYLSSDNTSFPQSLDCKDCHDVTLTSFPNHDNTTWTNDAGTDNARKKSTNPYGLRNVSQPKAYDDLCRNCHRSQASFTTFTGGKSGAGAAKLVLVSHDNGADNGALAIKDLDNTPLRTQMEWNSKRQCTLCHDAHYSNNGHLFSDGHEKWTVGQKAAISETNCTNVCHFKGDADNSFDTHGHGKPYNWTGSMPIGKTCTSACHDVGQPHDRSNADYATRYRFAPLAPSLLDNSIFKKPVRTVCEGCHKAADYPLHSTKKGNVGCIDCHDQHAKYSDNNVMMIRRTNRVAGYQVPGMTSGTGYLIGTEPVLFAKSPKYPGVPTDNHFFTNTIYGGDNAAGFCDQRACHGAGVAADNVTSLIPLATLLSTGKHSGSNQGVNSNCEACHQHSDGGGSFRAKTSCTLCHGQPPPPADNTGGAAYGYNESYTGHQKHAGAGYAIDCQMCHSHYTDNNYHNTPTKTFQSVSFDPSKNRGGVGSYDNVNLSCQNITCHSDGRGGAPENTTFQWVIPPTPGTKATLHCNDCHKGDSNPTRMSTGAHGAHLDSGYGCSTCHVATVQDDNVTLNATTGYTYHVDNTRTVSIKAAYDNDANSMNNWNVADNTCSGVTCHGGNKVDWYAAPGSITCGSCHVRNGDVDDFGSGTPASMKGNGVTAGIDNAEWMWSGHGRLAASGNYDSSGNPPANFTGAKPCLYCHDDAVKHDNAANPFRLANNNWSGFGWNGNCQICHSKTVTAPGYNYPGGPGLRVASSASWVDNAHFGAKHVSLDNTGGKFCYDCHDPHGDRVSGSGNIFMIGKRVSMRTDNTFGIPAGGNDNTSRPAPVFTDNATGASYADNAAPYDGICNVCHTGSLGHYRNNYGDAHNRISRCTTCHSHDKNFKGAGGPNIEQFFDNAYRSDNNSNYRDLSGHRIKAGTTAAGLYDNNQVDCYSCHGVSGSAYKSNECLVCHYEYRTSGTPDHPDQTFQWATPATPGTPLAAYPSGTLDNNSALCLACHAVGSPPTLNGVTPPDIRQGGETSWTTGSSGHGSVDNLSGTAGVGPPAYQCKACHYSTVRVTGGESRDQAADPGFHGSMNRKLVGNDNASAREFPHPSDTLHTTVNSRSQQMDSYCATKCHRNTTNGLSKDDNVVDHTWDNVAGQSRASQPGASHPTDMAPVPDAQQYQNPTSLPLSDYLGGALPGTGNVVCVTCHDPHGGGNITKGGVPQTGGAKNMLRLSPADNTSTLCMQCHK